MFVYLSQSGGRVELPEAVEVAGAPDDEFVRFLAASGDVVAIFRRADVVLHTDEDLGPVQRAD